MIKIVHIFKSIRVMIIGVKIKPFNNVTRKFNKNLLNA